MKLDASLKTYLILFFFIILGYVFMSLPEIYLPSEELDQNWSFIYQLSVLALVLLTNMWTVYQFKLKHEFFEQWTLKKIGYFPMGILLGISVMAMPLLLGLLTGRGSWEELKFDYEIPGLQPVSFLFLAIITLWEELWFRGIFLHYAKRRISVWNISLFMGILFMISYSLYSRGNFLVVAPNFLCLGVLFILLYFHFKTNWLTFGLMMGINMATANSPFKDDWLIGRFGILTAVLWAIILIWVFNKWKHSKQSAMEMETSA